MDRGGKAMFSEHGPLHAGKSLLFALPNPRLLPTSWRSVTEVFGHAAISSNQKTVHVVNQLHSEKCYFRRNNP